MRTLLTAAVPLGAGLAGLADGIVLHQVLQWHHLLCQETHCTSTSVADLQAKNFADGLFHAVCWALVVFGLVALVRLAPQAGPGFGRRFAGLVIASAGAFNVVEGLIDHQLLGIHHVRFGPGQPAWDTAFLALGATLWAGGWWWSRKAVRV